MYNKYTNIVEKGVNMIIKSIRIKNFRSLVDETIELSDMNFFVGKNDSGKSNVLKALNLFFNGETDFGSPFDFSADYSKFAKKIAKHAKEITISLNVIMPDSFQETGVKTWTKVWRERGLHSDNIDDIFKRGSKGSTYLNRIQYMYIPAVKSDEYFKYLLSQLYLSMTKTANSALQHLNDQYSTQLQNLTSDLTSQLKDVLNLQSAIQMPEDLNVLFRDLTFSTSDALVQGINLNHRGDGVKARHIPSILRYMQNNIEKFKLRGSISNSFIWGYEEPENGVEYLSCFEMADELYSYSNKCQMLVTTHSPAFYMKSNAENSKCFYVYKCEAGPSKYETNVASIDIDEKIGFLPLVAPYIENERRKYLEKEEALSREIASISKKYRQIRGKIVILTEGKTDTKYLQFAVTQLNLDAELVGKLEYYDFENNSTLGDDLNKLLCHLSKMPNENIIIGVFDRDKHIQPNDRGKMYKTLGNRVFRFNIPALANAERNETDRICIEHYFSNQEIETETDHGHLYMGKDFNSHGLSNDGNWCFQNYENNHSITPITIIDSACRHMQKLTDSARIISKDNFVEYVINHPEKFNFANFRKIFDVIVSIDKDANGVATQESMCNHVGDFVQTACLQNLENAI